MTGPRALVFDLDGVVLDSEPAIRGAVDDALATVGQPPTTDDEIRSMIGPAITSGFASVLADRGMAEPPLGDLESAYRASYRIRGPADTRCFPGMWEVLEALDAEPDVLLGVATSKPRPSTEAILGSIGLSRLFPVVEAPDLSWTAEPKAELLGRVLVRLGVEPGPRHCMVGDRHHDVTAAIANGVRPVGVAWGYGSREELTGAGAEIVVERPADLLEFVSW